MLYTHVPNLRLAGLYEAAATVHTKCIGYKLINNTVIVGPPTYQQKAHIINAARQRCLKHM